MRTFVLFLFSLFLFANLNKDLYQILNCDKKSNKKEIQKCFQKRARKIHPDVAKPKLKKKLGRELTEKESKDIEAKFAELANSYEILKDPKKKQMYDQYGITDEQQMPNQGFQRRGGFQNFDGFQQHFRTGRSGNSRFSFSFGGGGFPGFEGFENFGFGGQRQHQQRSRNKYEAFNDLSKISNNKKFLFNSKFYRKIGKNFKIFIIFKYKLTRTNFGKKLFRSDYKYIEGYQEIMEKLNAKYSLNLDSEFQIPLEFYKQEGEQFEIEIIVDKKQYIFPVSSKEKRVHERNFFSFFQTKVIKENLGPKVAQMQVSNDQEIENFKKKRKGEGKPVVVLITKKTEINSIEGILNHKMKDFIDFIHLKIDPEKSDEITRIKELFSITIRPEKLPVLYTRIKIPQRTEKNRVIESVTKDQMIAEIMKCYKNLQFINYDSPNPSKVHDFCYEQKCIFYFADYLGDKEKEDSIHEHNKLILESIKGYRIVYFDSKFFFDIDQDDDIIWNIIVPDEDLQYIREFKPKGKGKEKLQKKEFQNWLHGYSSTRRRRRTREEWIDFDFFSLPFMKNDVSFYENADFKTITYTIAIILGLILLRRVKKKIGKKCTCQTCCFYSLIFCIILFVALVALLLSQLLEFMDDIKIDFSFN